MVDKTGIINSTFYVTVLYTGKIFYLAHVKIFCVNRFIYVTCVHDDRGSDYFKYFIKTEIPKCIC